MAQSIQEYVESRRTARMTHEPQVNPDEIVIRSFLGPAALSKRIETQQAQVRAQREAHENDQKVHMQEQMRIQQQLEARYRPSGATASSPGRHSQTAETTAAPTGPPSVSQQQQDLVEKYRRQMEEEQKARAMASRVGPFLRLRSNAEDDRRAALRATTAPSASLTSQANHTIRSLGSTAKKSQKLDHTARSDGRGRASPLSIDGVGGQQNIGQPQPPRHNGPRYVIHTGITTCQDDIPLKPSTANGGGGRASAAPAAAATATGSGVVTDSTVVASSSSGVVDGTTSNTKPIPLTTDVLQQSAATGILGATMSAHGIDSVDRPSTQQHYRQAPPPLFANPSSLVRDEVAHRSIHQGPVIFNYSPRPQNQAAHNNKGGGGGGCAFYDDNTIRPQSSSSPHNSPSPASRYSNANSPTSTRGGGGGQHQQQQQLPQIHNTGNSPSTSSLRHVPLELQPLVVSVGNDPKQYVTPTPVSKWYPSLQTRLAEKAALELAANPPPEPEPTISNGDTPPLGTAPPAASPAPKKKKKAPVDTSVVSAASLSPTLGAALELNIKSSMYDSTLTEQAHKHRDKIWEVAMQFQQPPPPPVIKKKKASVSGPGAKRMSSIGAGARGSTPPKKKKKGVQGPPPDPTTTIHPNLRSLFSELRSVTDDQGRISSLKFTHAMKELGVSDLTHINSIFLHLESKNTCPGFVQLGSAMAVFHQLLNGEFTRQLLADVCFDLFDLDDRGYIHKAHLDCLRYLRTGLDGGGTHQNPSTSAAAASSSSAATGGTIEYTTTSSEVEEALRLSSRKCARRILVEEEDRRNKLDILMGKRGSLSVSSLIPNAPTTTTHIPLEQHELANNGANTTTNPAHSDNTNATSTTAATNNNFLGTNVNVINADTHPSLPHALCTPHMVRVLQGLFIDVRRAEEEEYIARVIRKGKKGKASKKKLPVLPDTQNSYIPISNMRVAHIGRETFRTHFSVSPQLVEAFACRWLLLLAVGDHEQLVLDDGALTQSNAFGGGDEDDDDMDAASKPVNFRLVTMADVALTAIDRYENPPTFPPAPSP